MEKTKNIIERLSRTLFPNQAAPQLAKVLKAHEGPGNTAYSVDVQLLDPGSMEETGHIIGEVSISPLWIGQKGKGIYAIPPKDSLVVVEFLNWNPAFPFIASMWADGYDAGEFKIGQLVITDGEGLRLGVDIDSLFFFETKNQSLKKILEQLIDEIIDLQTQGPPPSHTVSPLSISKLNALKIEIAKLLK